MQDKSNRQDSNARNEGEGNKTAARHYNQAQQEFVRSGQVEDKAREAEEALAGPEKSDLRRAEMIGKSHSHGEDPKLKGKR